jgi:hypothetical protein
MKNIIFLFIAAVFASSCSDQKQSTANKNSNGYTAIETENVNLVKKLNELAVQYDTAALKEAYSSISDTIHDNLHSMTVGENMKMLGELQVSGITTKIDNYYAIWETINDKPNDKGVTNYVIAYLNLTFSKGDKSVHSLFHQVFAMKDGKVVEEWDIYDTKVLDELYK